MSIWDRLKLLRIYIALVRNPMRTELIFSAISIVSKYKDDPVTRVLVARILARPGFAALWEERYVPAWPTLEQLGEYADGSFGRALYDHVRANNLNLNLFPRVNPQDPIDYLNARAYQDHDLWHALLGYGTCVEDELALQAFGVAQFGSPLGLFLISGGLLHLMIRDPLKAIDGFKGIADGYRRGEEMPFLLGMKLMDMLPEPLSEMRARMGVAA